MAEFNENLKIAIIGAGPGGLSAAEALWEKGYRNITVFEKSKRAGGMSLSQTLETPDGRKIIYELGSLQPVSTGTGKFKHLLKKYKMHTGKPDTNYKTVHGKLYSLSKRNYILDFTKSPIGYPLNKIWQFTMDSFKLLMLLLKYKTLAKPGYARLSKNDLVDLSIPYEDWIDQQNFKLISDSIKYNAGSMLCYADVDKKKNIPALKYIKNIWVFMKFPVRYINGKFRLMREGYQELWNRVANQHRVIYGVQIKRIKRDEQITIEFEDGETVKFDELIITCSPTQTKKMLELSASEMNVFDNIIYCPGWRCTFLAKNLPADAVYGIYEPMFAKNQRPSLICFYPEGKYDAETTLYGSVISGDKNSLEEGLKDAETVLKDHFNGEIVKWIDKIYWAEYGAHFSCENTKQGIYEDYEALQGNLHTYYAGASISGGTHPVVVEYSYDLIRRFF